MTSIYGSNEIAAPAVGDKSAQPHAADQPGGNQLLKPFLEQGQGQTRASSKQEVNGTGIVDDPLLLRRDQTVEPLTEAQKEEINRRIESTPLQEPADTRWIALPEGYHCVPEKPKELTPEKVESLRKEMEKSVDDLVPDAQKALLKKMRDGAIDGNPAAIQEAYKTLKDDPKMLQAMVKELNKEFEKLGSGAVFGVTDDNRLLLSADGSNGIVISDKGVSPASVTGGNDGYIHLAQEQHPPSSVDEVAAAVRKDICTEHALFFPSHSSDPIWKNQKSSFPKWLKEN